MQILVIINHIFIDDCLKLLKVVAIDVFQKKIIKFFLWLNLLFHVIITIVTLYFMLFVLNRAETIGYVPAFLGDFYVSYTASLKTKIYFKILSPWLQFGQFCKKQNWRI